MNFITLTVYTSSGTYIFNDVSGFILDAATAQFTYTTNQGETRRAFFFVAGILGFTGVEAA